MDDDLLLKRFQLIEEKLDKILFELDSDFIVLDIKPSTPNSFLSYFDNSKQLITTALPYTVPYILPYIYLGLQLFCNT